MSYRYRFSISNIFTEYMHSVRFVFAVVLLLPILSVVSGCFAPSDIVSPKTKMSKVEIAKKSEDPTRRTTIAISPDSKLIAVSRANANSIGLWDVVKSQLICSIDPKFYPNRIGFTRNGVPFYGGDGGIVYLDKKTGEPLKMSPLQAHKPGRIKMCYTAIQTDKFGQTLMADETSKYDLSFAKDKITILDSETKVKIRSFKINVNTSGLYMFSSTACLSSDGNYICILETSKGIPINTNTSSTTAESFSIIRIYNANLVPPCGEIKLSGVVRKVVYSTDGNTFMVLNEGKALLYNSDTLDRMYTLSSGNEPIMDVAYSPDNKYVVTGDGTRRIEIWDAKTGEHIKTLEKPRVD